ncbi:hypothetical protein Sjap_021366 [Stephania japonica]|uniref:N-acetyltransferase domain-containing protein n=1 Tax=Stephania japonica TaxID=461633 RepID=A0AAP0EM93_9MAGN
MSAAAMALPPLSIRGDLSVLSTTAARYICSFILGKWDPRESEIYWYILSRDGNYYVEDEMKSRYGGRLPQSWALQKMDVGMVGEGEHDVNKGQFGSLVNEFGWRVRRLVEEEEEMRKVAQVQAEAFHDPVVFFNDLFFQFFKAEVLSGLIYKLRNSPPNRYACLIAEPTETADLLHTLERRLVGVVDITVLRDESVLCHLEGAEEYLYVSGIAVSKEYRRKVATALLKACDLLALLWGFDYLVLRAYEDDLAARTLYQNAGYRVVSGDPPWMTTWVGRKRRILMVKRSSIGMYAFGLSYNS